MKFGQRSAQDDLQVKLHVTMREETFYSSKKKKVLTS